MEYNNLNSQILNTGNIVTNSVYGSTQKQRYGNLSAELSYDIDTLNLISVNCGVMTWAQKREGIMDFYVNNEFTAANNSKTKYGYNSYWAGIDYQHTFKSNPQRMVLTKTTTRHIRKHYKIMFQIFMIFLDENTPTTREVANILSKLTIQRR